MKIIALTLQGTHDEFDQLQSAMFDDGHKLGAMQIRLLMNHPKRDTAEFIGGNNVLAAAVEIGLITLDRSGETE